MFCCFRAIPNTILIIENGTVYDGSGNEPYIADIGINADTIAFIGNLKNKKAIKTIDAEGLSVCPCFINSLSRAAESLLLDGRSMSDIKQDVTLEVFGEGETLEPLNTKQFTDTALLTLGEHLDYMANKGIATNIASFVGAASVRSYIAGCENRGLSDASMY